MTSRYVPDFSEPDEWSPGMPVSTHEGKDWIESLISIFKPQSVLDVGAGEGIYSMRMRCLTSRSAVWHAVEVFEPYVDQFDLRTKYDHVFVADVRDLSFGAYDLVIFGDVLEHLPREDAVSVIRYAQTRAKHVVVSVPTVRMEQGCVNGNDAEAHLYHWGFREMFGVLDGSPESHFIRAIPGDVVGCYWWSSRASSD